VDGGGYLFDKLAAYLALIIPHQQVIEFRPGSGHIDIVGHAAPRPFDRNDGLSE
jgi:hypothetical protein